MARLFWRKPSNPSLITRPCALLMLRLTDSDLPHGIIRLIAGRENGNCYTVYWGYIVIMGLYRINVTENGNYDIAYWGCIGLMERNRKLL